MIFKLDFDKPFDRVDRNFLDKVVEKKGFGELKRKWICSSLVVNGYP